jgi:branched-subunit amino acid aminotransferase/4-amino-4-deoxychorismate lyase
VEERRLERSKLPEASAVILTGSLIGTAPLLTLDGRRLETHDAEEVAGFKP